VSDAVPAAAPATALDRLFRHEAGRMAGAVVRLVGLSNLDLVEDVVQDALVQAMEVWKYGRLPDNPAAWLMRAAKNRAIDVIRRQRTARRFAPEMAELLMTEWTTVAAVESAFLEKEIADGELRLMFSLCDGRLPVETQVLVVLKYLCGFGTRELAQAFLLGEDAVEKRLGRARATLQATGALAEIADEARLRARLPGVRQALYLLFSEGYHGAHPEHVVREDLCAEALRLGELLAGHPVTGLPEVHALLALMYLLSARLATRRDAAGDLVPLEEQDRTRWDAALIARGFAALDRSAEGEVLTDMHLEAAIAAKHAAAPAWAATDWAGIVALYDRLYVLRPTPIVALNRAVAVGQAAGPAAGLDALDDIVGVERLEDYLFLAATRADLLRRDGRLAEAVPHYQRAAQLARSEPERRHFARRLAECTGAAPGDRSR
jgi:RNA polymerase sigma-70 factor (ECF subfamily)